MAAMTALEVITISAFLAAAWCVAALGLVGIH